VIARSATVAWLVVGRIHHPKRADEARAEPRAGALVLERDQVLGREQHGVSDRNGRSIPARGLLLILDLRSLEVIPASSGQGDDASSGCFVVGNIRLFAAKVPWESSPPTESDLKRRETGARTDAAVEGELG